METSPLKVLLLGWDDTYHQLPSVPAPLGLARTLSSHTDLTVVLPSLPAATEPIAGAELTAIGNLSVEELQAAIAQERGAVTQRQGWESPAAPYQGATPTEQDPFANSQGAAFTTDGGPSSQLLIDPLEAGFDSIGEPKGDEANDLDQGMPLAAEPAPKPADFRSLLPPNAERTTPDHALAILSSGVNDGASLNFRVIQYARFATPLVAEKPFQVIYAADWPTWLAAMEIRQRTGRPLVLHVHSLCSDRNTTDDRGWIQELERLALRRADLILVDSEELCHRLRQHYNIPLHRTHVQHGEVNAEEVSRVMQHVLEVAQLKANRHQPA
ncbi:glycosyltransferase [Hymenobacter sp. BT730]|uniref:glycosyltransferase n=1 Tax=Hymenobacter sp. BT730 TaxID=3063332 RepID=UPI0026DEB249|nr:glycosyltransferase [Hymenobacter sp. BT730]